MSLNAHSHNHLGRRLHRCGPALPTTGTILALVAAMTISSPASATLSLEFDFNTDENASFAGPGVNGTATLGGGATINTGTAVGPGNDKFLVTPNLANGFMTINNRNGDNLTTGARFSEAFGAPGNNFGQGTFITVIRPNFSPTTQRQWFFTHTQAGTANYIGLLSQGGLQGAGGRNTENSFGLTEPDSSNFPWDPNEWFFVGMSWQQSSGTDGSAPPTPLGDPVGLPDGQLRLYARQITDNGDLSLSSPITFDSDDLVRLWHTRFATDQVNSPLTLGNRRGFGGGELSEGGLGDYALFQFHDQRFDLADFDNAFNSLFVQVPEPSSGLLMSVALLGIARRRRHR